MVLCGFTLLTLIQTSYAAAHKNSEADINETPPFLAR
jgi:hypothetical protein